MNAKQEKVVDSLKKEHGADRATVNTLEVGSILVILWKQGKDTDVGRFRVTRTGKIKEQ